MSNAVRLPEGYTELQYVECNGNQYLDTEVNATSSTIVEGIFMPRSSSSTDLFGASYYRYFSYGSTRLYTYDGYYCNTNGGGSSYWYLYYDSASTPVMSHNYATASTAINTWYTFKMSRSNIIVNNTAHNYNGGSVTNTLSMSYSMLIGGIQTQTAKNSSFIGYIGEFKIYNGTTPVKDYVPAKNSNNQIGFYDLVNGTFHQSGSGTAFIAGPEL